MGCKVFVLLVLVFGLGMTATIAERQVQEEPSFYDLMKNDRAPAVGEIAPPFKLLSANDVPGVAELAMLTGDKPLVLIFGSYS